MNNIKILDFFTNWCSPCKLMSPIIEQLKEELTDIEIVKINADQNQELAQQYNIMSVPTLILLKDGIEVSRKTGFQPKNLIIKWINEYKEEE